MVDSVHQAAQLVAYPRDVVLGLGPWSLVVLKDKIAVLGPGLGLEPSVLGPVLGLTC